MHHDAYCTAAAGDPRAPQQQCTTGGHGQGRTRRDLAVVVLVDAGREQSGGRSGRLPWGANPHRIDLASHHRIPVGAVWIRGQGRFWPGPSADLSSRRNTAHAITSRREREARLLPSAAQGEARRAGWGGRRGLGRKGRRRGGRWWCRRWPVATPSCPPQRG